MAVPVALYVAWLYAAHLHIARTFDRLHLRLLAISALLVVVAEVLAAAGASISSCIVVLALVPWVTVVGYEVRNAQQPTITA